MSRHCQVLGTKPGFGNNVSHSQRRTKRRWNPNIQKKRYWVPSLGKKVTLALTLKAMKEIDRCGVDTVVARMLARGERI